MASLSKPIIKTDFQYTVVLTSCGRFDLLRRTVETFLHFADIAPTEFIITEDSGNKQVRDILDGLDAPFKFIINNPRLGQVASIDAAYAQVKTPYVFHCEDDWEFFRTGFIAESLTLLEAFPNVSAVMLRGRDEHRKLRKLQTEELNGIRFVRAYPKMFKHYFGYGYNPGLRRMSDYKRFAPFSKIGGEACVSCAFMLLGFATAHLDVPAVCHLGWGQHIDGISPTFFIQRKIQRYRKKFKLLSWRFLGLPKRLRHITNQPKL